MVNIGELAIIVVIIFSIMGGFFLGCFYTAQVITDNYLSKWCEDINCGVLCCNRILARQDNNINDSFFESTHSSS